MNHITAMKQALEALERYAPQHGHPDDMSDAITALRTAIEQAEKQEPVAWGWAIMHSDGTKASVRPRIVDFFGCIQEKEPFTSEDAKRADQEWAGLAPHTIVTLYTTPPAAPVQEPVGDEWTPCMKLPVVVHVRKQRPGESHVSTREGITPVKPDDLIMRGVSGEEYPIGRAIFEQTYTMETTPPAQPAPVPWSQALESVWAEDYTTPPAAQTAPVQPEQEQKPYAYANPDDLSADTAFRWCKINEFTMPVYTTPPAAPVQPEQEPVAKVRVHMTGGNPGLAWSATAVNSYDSLPPLADGTLLYTAAQPAPEQYTALEQALTRLQKRYGELEAKAAAEEAVPKVVDAAIAAERKANSRARAGKPRQLPRIGTGALHAEQQCCFAMGWKEGAAAVRAAIRARGTNHG